MARILRFALLLLLCPVRAAPAQDVRSTPAGVMLDFEEQDIRNVIQALSAAAGSNVLFSSLPSRKVTLKMDAPVPRDSLVNVMRAVAEANGLTMTKVGAVYRIDAPPAAPTQGRGQSLAQLLQGQQAQLELFSYRLKHASAQDLAQVLTQIFTGSPRTITIGGPGGTQITAPQILTPQGLVGGANTNAGGRGGRTGGGGRGGFAQQLIEQAAAQAAGVLSGSAADIRIVAEQSTNTLIVRSTAQDFQLIQQVIQSVDVRPLQVLIEVTIAEVERSNHLSLGLSGTANHKAKGANGPTQGINIPSSASERDLIAQLTGTGGAVDFNLAINALSDRGVVRVLSLPIIIAQNNKEAKLNVGSQRPFVQVTQTVPQDPTSRVQTVQYIDVGTTLTITPVINPDGYVNLTVDQTDDAATNEVQFDAPVITKREASTQIFLRDGQTTVIGGLAGRTHNRTDSGIPFLSHLPLIGWLFGNTQRTEVTNELFVFLTPHLVMADADIDRLRDAVKSGSTLLKQQDMVPMIHPVTTDTLSIPRDSLRVRPDTSRRAVPDTGRRRPPVDTSAVRPR